jgi:hypothetical protein
MHEWRTEKNKESGEEDFFNVGDRFMDIIEDVAAYVPYMVMNK